jgi:hypothetical protein
VPLPIPFGIEIRFVDVQLTGLVLSPLQLNAEPLLGSEDVDQAPSQVYPLVAVGEMLHPCSMLAAVKP